MDPEPAVLHTPVLLDEVVSALLPAFSEANPDGAVPRVLDCTLGLGGHALALAQAGAVIVGVDRDREARDLALARFARAGCAERLTVIAATFAEAVEELVQSGQRFTGVLADLGVSSLQLDRPERGFSWRSDDIAPDMRMGDGCPESALELMERLDEEALADIIFRYGEERLSRRVAKAIKKTLAAGVLKTNADLADAVRAAIPGHHPRHPAMRTFQALRIAVNDELGQLERLLVALPALLVPGGRVAIISFHSLEDRAVKQSLRQGLQSGVWADVARKVATASDVELAANPRAGSAKLRWAIRARPAPAGTVSARVPPPYFPL